MISYLYTSDYDDRNPCRPTAVAASSEEPADVPKEDEKKPVSPFQSAAKINGAQPKTVESLPESAEQGEASTTGGEGDSEPWLLDNVLVYIIGEKYGVGGLKELAKAKFRDQAERLLSIKEFPEIIGNLYGSTPASDRGLRDVVSHICVHQVRKLVDSPGLNAVIQERGDFGLDILRESLNCYEERQEEEEETKAELETKLDEKKAEIRNLQQRMSYCHKVLRRVAKDIESDTTSLFC